MTLEEIKPIVDGWLESNYLSIENQEKLKAEYSARGFGLPGQCTPCYWQNVQVYFQLELRKQARSKMNPSTKYRLRPGVGPFRPHGEIYNVVSHGGNGVTSRTLTDELAEQLLKRNPDYADLIEEMPSVETLTIDETTGQLQPEKKTESAEAKAVKALEDAKKAREKKTTNQAGQPKKTAKQRETDQLLKEATKVETKPIEGSKVVDTPRDTAAKAAALAEMGGDPTVQVNDAKKIEPESDATLIASNPATSNYTGTGQVTDNSLENEGKPKE